MPDMRFSPLPVAVFAFVLVAAACAGPSVAPPHGRQVEHSPEQLARGRYLAEHVAICVDCHSTRDWTRFSAPVVAGSEGRGGETWGKELGFPGTIVAPNISPTALAGWSDGDVDRALTVGVGKDGRALFPFMPWGNYAKLCQNDVDALVVWVRTLPPADNVPPRTELSFPMSLIVNSLPKDTARPACPDVKNAVEYGAYLANAAGCVECHSQVKRGQIIEGHEWAGGRALKLPTGTATSPNLTPAGVLGGFNADAFVARMRQHGTPDTAPRVEGSSPQSPMAWTLYGGMTDDDLTAIFAFLQTLPKKETPKDAGPPWAPSKP